MYNECEQNATTKWKKKNRIKKIVCLRLSPNRRRSRQKTHESRNQKKKEKNAKKKKRKNASAKCSHTQMNAQNDNAHIYKFIGLSRVLFRAIYFAFSLILTCYSCLGIYMQKKIEPNAMQRHRLQHKQCEFSHSIIVDCIWFNRDFVISVNERLYFGKLFC